MISVWLISVLFVGRSGGSILSSMVNSVSRKGAYIQRVVF
jgi:hypothetical protein